MSWRLLLLLVAATATARADEAPVVDLVTMGPGNDIFEAFGHGTLCVTDAGHPDGLCYHYGRCSWCGISCGGRRGSGPRRPRWGG